jgi:hypothetical protein
MQDAGHDPAFLLLSDNDIAIAGVADFAHNFLQVHVGQSIVGVIPN